MPPLVTVVRRGARAPFLVLLLATLLPARIAVAQQRVPLDGTWELANDAAMRSYGRQVEVPSAFETALGTDFDGVAWYRRALPIDASMRGAAVRIEFAAVATHATVFVNGTEVGQHLGGWTPFRVDATAALRWDGNDVLEVKVDEKVGHNTQGFLPIVQPHFGGIWQPVTLCIDRGPVIDRLSLFTLGRYRDVRWSQPPGELTVRANVLAAADVSMEIAVLDGSSVVAHERAVARAGQPLQATLGLAQVRPWSVAAPNLYTVRLRLLDGERELDRVERRVGFRSLRADGTKVLWNGEPLQLRALLHWGYSPPHLAPPCDEAFWRAQLEDVRSLGFNGVKCCLWVPPPCVYDICDEIGLLVWQEYPTWHPKLDQAHKQELLAEYREFFAHDGSHPSVAFRSITCETGHDADLDVVSALWHACKEAVPDTLVVDDSSWIGWQRITDFWDEHPYGNNRWWPGRLAEFRQHIATKGEKPLLLGECIAADTWFDRAEWLRRHGDTAHWWRPECFADQARFEDWIRGEFGDGVLQGLLPVSLDYGMRTRRYQIERLRLSIPDAGYVVSVARDVPKCRMGLWDDFGRLKWDAGDWSWQRDDMLCLDTDGDRRAFVTGSEPVRPRVRAVRGTQVGEPVLLDPLPRVDAPARTRAVADVDGLHASWDLWALPPFDAAPPAGVRIADRVDLALLDFLAGGGRALLRVDGQQGALRSEAMWWLRGAPFAPAHAVHARVPADLLVELQPFDLDGGRAMPWDLLRGQVDPILAFWETHDVPEVRAHLFAFDCRVGEGRLLASCLDRTTDAGRFVERQFLEHLANGPAPRRSLAPATLASLRALLAERRIELPVWRFRTDPQDEGLAAGWQTPATDAAAAPWRDLRAGSHWENQGEDLKHYTGVAWYRVDVDVPADWAEQDARAVFEGVDDSFVLFVDGVEVARRGDPATNTTIWLERQVVELGTRLAPGRHAIVLRVVDHAGAGGLWKPAFVTTGPADGTDRLLQ